MQDHRLRRARTIRCREISAGLAIAAMLLVCPAAARPAETAQAHEIVLLPDTTPQRSGDRDPSSRALIETWLAGYGWNKDKHFDLERYEIVTRRVVWGELGRALLQFRVLSRNGDAMALAAQRCPGRDRPIEMQIYFQWSADNRLWTALANRGDPGFAPCSNDALWTGEQIELIVDPPPLPAPPRIAQEDVVTPPPGSPERRAILDGLRPTFEAAFGKPVAFRVESLRVAAGFAWVVVHPQRPDGAPIGKSEWDKAVGPCEQNQADAVAQFWMRRRGDGWRVGWENGVCASDSIAELGYLIGAPPRLAGLEGWPRTDFMPVQDPQYFALWQP